MMLTFSMDALFIRGMRKHRHLGIATPSGGGIHSINQVYPFRPEGDLQVRRDERLESERKRSSPEGVSAT